MRVLFYLVVVATIAGFSSVEASSGPGPGMSSGSYSKTADTYCSDSSGSYSSYMDATNACTAMVLPFACTGIYIKGCSGSDYALCTSRGGSDTYKSSSTGSCVWKIGPCRHSADIMCRHTTTSRSTSPYSPMSADAAACAVAGTTWGNRCVAISGCKWTPNPWGNTCTPISLAKAVADAAAAAKAMADAAGSGYSYSSSGGGSGYIDDGVSGSIVPTWPSGKDISEQMCTAITPAIDYVNTKLTDLLGAGVASCACTDNDDGFAGSCTLRIPEVKIGIGPLFSFEMPRLRFKATVDFQICTEPMGVKLTIEEESRGTTLPSITKEISMPQTYPIPIEIRGSSIGVPGITITVKTKVELRGNTIADLQVEVLLTDICVRPEASKAGSTLDICLTKLEAKVKTFDSRYASPGSIAWSQVPSQAQKVIAKFPFTLVTLATADYGVACRAKPGGGGGGGGGAAAAAIVVVLLLLFIGGAVAFVVKARKDGVNPSDKFQELCCNAKSSKTKSAAAAVTPIVVSVDINNEPVAGTAAKTKMALVVSKSDRTASTDFGADVVENVPETKHRDEDGNSALTNAAKTGAAASASPAEVSVDNGLSSPPPPISADELLDSIGLLEHKAEIQALTGKTWDVHALSFIEKEDLAETSMSVVEKKKLLAAVARATEPGL